VAPAPADPATSHRLGISLATKAADITIRDQTVSRRALRRELGIDYATADR
jgi:hypothetical protein